MFKLKKLNVVKIVDSENKRDELLGKGFELVEEKSAKQKEKAQTKNANTENGQDDKKKEEERKPEDNKKSVKSTGK